MAVVEKGVDRQQLDARDAEPLEMIDHRRLGQAAKRAAQLRRDILALLRQAFDVGLIDDRIFPGDPVAVRAQVCAVSTTTDLCMTRELSRRSNDRSACLCRRR